MNTTSGKPDSVSSVNITPLDPRSLRTMCCTAADKRHLAVLETLMYPVGNGAIVVERREDLAHGVEDVVDPFDVEEGFLLSGKGRIRQVFGGCRRAYRK